MQAHRFTQQAGIDVGSGREEQHPEQCHTAQLQGEQFCGQWPDRGEVADEGQPREHANGQPQAVLERATGQFVQAPGRRGQLDALVAVPLGNLFAPHE
ncbi:hypothetical protein D9M71_376570 [compost metagenome]